MCNSKLSKLSLVLLLSGGVSLAVTSLSAAEVSAGSPASTGTTNGTSDHNCAGTSCPITPITELELAKPATSDCTLDSAPEITSEQLRAQRAAALEHEVSLAEIALQVLDGKPVTEFPAAQQSIAKQWLELLPVLQVKYPRVSEGQWVSLFDLAAEAHAAFKAILIDLTNFVPEDEFQVAIFASVNKDSVLMSALGTENSGTTDKLDDKTLPALLRDIDRQMLKGLALQLGLNDLAHAELLKFESEIFREIELRDSLENVGPDTVVD